MQSRKTCPWIRESAAMCKNCCWHIIDDINFVIPFLFTWCFTEGTITMDQRVCLLTAFIHSMYNTDNTGWFSKILTDIRRQIFPYGNKIRKEFKKDHNLCYNVSCLCMVKIPSQTMLWLLWYGYLYKLCNNSLCPRADPSD